MTDVKTEAAKEEIAQAEAKTTTEPTTTGIATGQNGGSVTVTFESQEAFQQRVDEMLKDRLEREKAKRATAATKAREAAEAQALEAQGKYKELAAAAQARVAELEPQVETLSGKVTEYEEALTSLLVEEKKNVPEWARSLLDNLNPAQQLKYIAANRDRFGTAGRVTETPRGSNGQGLKQEEIEAVQQQHGAQTHSQF